MDAIVWLICSWVVVGLLSYIFVTRVGIGPQPGQLQENVSISRPNQVSNRYIFKIINQFIRSFV